MQPGHQSYFASSLELLDNHSFYVLIFHHASDVVHSLHLCTLAPAVRHQCQLDPRIEWNSQSQGKTDIVPWATTPKVGVPQDSGWDWCFNAWFALLINSGLYKLQFFLTALAAHLQTYPQYLGSSETNYRNPLSWNWQSHKIWNVRLRWSISPWKDCFTFGGQAQIILNLEPCMLGGIILNQLDGFPLGHGNVLIHRPRYLSATTDTQGWHQRNSLLLAWPPWALLIF